MINDIQIHPATSILVYLNAINLASVHDFSWFHMNEGRGEHWSQLSKSNPVVLIRGQGLINHSAIETKFHVGRGLACIGAAGNPRSYEIISANLRAPTWNENGLRTDITKLWIFRLVLGGELTLELRTSWDTRNHVIRWNETLKFIWPIRSFIPR